MRKVTFDGYNDAWTLRLVRNFNLHVSLTQTAPESQGDNFLLCNRRDRWGVGHSGRAQAMCHCDNMIAESWPSHHSMRMRIATVQMEWFFQNYKSFL